MKRGNMVKREMVKEVEFEEKVNHEIDGVRYFRGYEIFFEFL
jgi:hypothetical protein